LGEPSEEARELEAEKLRQPAFASRLRPTAEVPKVRRVRRDEDKLIFDALLNLSAEEMEELEREQDEAHRVAGPVTGGWR